MSSIDDVTVEAVTGEQLLQRVAQMGRGGIDELSEECQAAMEGILAANADALMQRVVDSIPLKLLVTMMDYEEVWALPHERDSVVMAFIGACQTRYLKAVRRGDIVEVQ
jgi:hypothetical protein